MKEVLEINLHSLYDISSYSDQLPAKPKLARGLFARHSDARSNPDAIGSELGAASTHPCTS